MLILVHTAHPQALANRGPGFGRLLSPRQFSRAADTAEAGIPWAADNDCFQRLDARAYKRMLQSLTGIPGCEFLVLPDVVGDAWATAERWAQWYPVAKLTGQPLALVAQDGLTAARCPWGAFDVLFVGGTTVWKEGSEAELLVREAKERGLWVHMGRVNSRRRFDYARAIGCDSIDGTKFSRWRDTWLPDALTWHTDHLQERLVTT